MRNKKTMILPTKAGLLKMLLPIEIISTLPEMYTIIKGMNAEKHPNIKAKIRPDFKKT